MKFLIMEDDGKGFDVTATPNGIGLQNIQEKLATWNGVFELDTFAVFGEDDKKESWSVFFFRLLPPPTLCDQFGYIFLRNANASFLVQLSCSQIKSNIVVPPCPKSCHTHLYVSPCRI